MNVSVLIVEDELIISEKIRMYIEALGYEVCGQAIDYTCLLYTSDAADE